MIQNPLISVVIPAYNAGQFLDETLESVLSQTYENWECIIVNDGSTDNTESVAKKWCEKDSRFRLTNKENGGLSSVRNWGIKESKAEYIAFLDADDILTPDSLEVRINVLIEQNVDLVATKLQHFTDKLPKVSKNNARQDVLYYAKEGLTQLMAFNKVTPSTVLCKKSVMDEVGGFTWHKKAEDLHCWLKVLFAGYKIYRIDETLLLYRLVENSMSSTDRNCSKEVFEIIYRFKDEILSLDIDLQIYINHWLRKYVFLQDEIGNILPNISERMAYVNTILPNFFPKWLIKLPLGEKITKLLAIQVMNRKIKEI